MSTYQTLKRLQIKWEFTKHFSRIQLPFSPKNENLLCDLSNGKEPKRIRDFKCKRSLVGSEVSKPCIAVLLLLAIFHVMHTAEENRSTRVCKCRQLLLKSLRWYKRNLYLSVY